MNWEEEDQGEFSTVYGDLITFVAVFFILIFTMLYHKDSDKTYYTEMNIELGGKTIEQPIELTGENTFISNLKGYIQSEQLSQYVQVLINDQKIRLIMNDQVLFKPGTAELLPSSKAALRGFANLVRKVENPVVVEGHTEETEAGLSDKTQWWVSMKRAYVVQQYLIDKEGISATRLSIAAYGPTRPFAPNTAQSKAKNNRVELAIIRIAKSQELK